MKKVIFILTFFLIILPKTSFAYWEWAVSSEETNWYFDNARTNILPINPKNYSDGLYINTWVKSEHIYDNEDGVRVCVENVLYYPIAEYTVSLYSIFYDKNGKVILSFKNDNPTHEPIVPGSYAEYLFNKIFVFVLKK